MKQISIANLNPGMVAAETILSGSNQVIVPKGTVFTENIITRLEGYYIYYVNVEEYRAIDLLHPFIHLPYSVSGASDAHRHVLGSFRRCREHYRSILTGLIYRNESFCFEDLLKEVLSIPISDNDVQDILFCINNTENSVYDHCLSVALLTNALSKWLHFSEDDCLLASACGLFHDAGKLLLPAGVFKNPGNPTPEEFSIIKTHAIETFHLLSKLKSIPNTVRNAALMHHERCDASGYPYGLGGDEISKFAKVVMIADDFDALLRSQTGHAVVCPISLVKYFEKEGLLKYEQSYLLTFLEHVFNACLDHKVMLDSGMGGTVLFISHEAPASLAACTESAESTDPQKEHYDSILQLSNIEKLSIETII